MVAFVKHELEYFLDQILISAQHAEQSRELTFKASVDILRNVPPNLLVSQGLRIIDGSLNNLRPARLEFGAQESVFLHVSDPEFRGAHDLPFDPDGPCSHHDLRKDDFIGMS